ncbi:RNA-directed DNA polymerase [Polaromonas sp.]|uniref:RNA-directed DNA polymerase n=1 Tax=Polaromonas sp. TaxID=1869339 RepID=UPI0013BD8AA0|nr:RNA-directed DNA polymerase [Polaromonas sp.]NDP62410.1 RNA-directed DNA polymerase [Polaromonas sp.]
MSAITPDQLLLIRALNSTKQSYFPSYMGLRVLGKNLSIQDPAYIHRMLERRIASCDKWSYKPFQLYKGSSNHNGKLVHEYRDCVAPNPSTALAGAHILAILASTPSFAVSTQVYSYLWPKSTSSGSSYSFFAEGYKRRNNEIFRALQGNDKIAVVADIKKFYPSVKIESITKSLKGLFQNIPNGSSDGFTNFFVQLLNASNGGIPIGPAPGHLLGHVALSQVDSDLYKKYGSNYFRYVDDIVIVCKSADRAVVLSDIENSVERSNFELNSSKTEYLTKEEWNSSNISADIPFEDDFRSFTRELTIYLALYEGRTQSLSDRLKGAGFSIPIERLKTLSNYSRFRYFLRRQKSITEVLKTLHVLRLDENYFVEKAMALKNLYEQSLLELCSESLTSPHLRRWKIQRARRLVNVLFYLRTFSEWGGPQDAFQAFPELVEQASLANALKGGIVNPVLPFFGQAPAAFAELWKEHGKTQAVLNLEPQLDDAKLNSLVLLRLHGTVAQSALPDIPKTPTGQLLLSTNDESPKSRTASDLSFEDEFESLRINTTGEEICTLARTRHSILEGAPLEALSLIGSEYMS